MRLRSTSQDSFSPLKFITPDNIIKITSSTTSISQTSQLPAPLNIKIPKVEKWDASEVLDIGIEPPSPSAYHRKQEFLEKKLRLREMELYKYNSWKMGLDKIKRETQVVVGGCVFKGVEETSIAGLVESCPRLRGAFLQRVFGRFDQIGVEQQPKVGKTTSKIVEDKTPKKVQRQSNRRKSRRKSTSINLQFEDFEPPALINLEDNPVMNKWLVNYRRALEKRRQRAAKKLL